MDQNEAGLQEELSRLYAKLPTVDDADIRNALQARIDEIEGQLRVDSTTPIAVEEAPAPVRLAPGSPEETEARAELTRLSRQLYTTEDPSARAHVQKRVGELQALLGIDVAKLGSTEMSANAIPDLSVAARPGKKVKEEPKGRTNMADLQAILAEKSAQIRKDPGEIPRDLDVPETFEPATPAQIEEAEKLIQQARVETIRNNRVRAQELLEEAARVAPGSSPVQEMLGDDYASRKMSAKAIAAYRRAVKLDPKNVNAERKLATMALSTDAAAAFQQSLAGNAESLASRRAAIILTIFLPGAGHLVMGKNAKGWTFLGLWVLCLAWMGFQGDDIAKLFSIPFGGRQQPHYIVIVPVIGALVLFILALADLKKPEETIRTPVARPTPPVNLPFE